jgi:hypothetical protein
MFSQGLYLYMKYVSPILMSSLGIFSDDHKVDLIKLRRLNDYLSSPSLASSINNTGFNIQSGRDGVCKAVLSAGKPTLVEAMAQIFEPNTDYGIFDLNEPQSAAQAQAVIATDSLEDILSAGIRTSVGSPITFADVPSLNSVVSGVINGASNFEVRRILQNGDSTFLDSNSLQAYLDELRSVSAGKELESATLTPTPIVTGSDEFGGDLVERYISNQLSIITESGYQSQTFGMRARPYDNPPADNPPGFVLRILDPVIITPGNLTL